jgi:hypothetical protein
MADGQTLLERAFELARSGTCRGVGDIRIQLKREGFDKIHATLVGAALLKQLSELCKKAYVVT